MDHTESGPRRAMRAFLVYGLWLLSAALAIGAMLWLRVFLLVDVPLAVRGINPWTLSSIDKFGTFLLGAGVLIFIVVSEASFHKFIDRGIPWRGVGMVLIVEALLLGLAYGGHLLLN